MGTPLKRGVGWNVPEQAPFSRLANFRPAPVAAAGERDGRLHRHHRHPAPTFPIVAQHFLGLAIVETGDEDLL